MKAHPLPVRKLLEPFERLMEESPTKLVRMKAKELLRDERLAEWGFDGAPGGIKKRKDESEEDEDEDEDEDHEIENSGEDDEEWGGIEED
jgi:ribosomal RNA-processing protein 1